MRKEYFALLKLIRKREELMDSAKGMSSPGFEQSYNPNYGTSSPYENNVIAAADLDGEIEKKALAFMHGTEDDDQRILTETTGQRQRVLRLHVVCDKSVEEIAEELEVSSRTVEYRLSGKVPERVCDTEFERYYRECDLLFIDAEIEECIAEMYRRVQKLVGMHFEELDEAIQMHMEKSAVCREMYKKSMAGIGETVNQLDEPEHTIVKCRLFRNWPWKRIAHDTGYSHSHARSIFSAALKQISTFADTY